MPVHAFSPPKGQLEFFETEGHPLLENLLGIRPRGRLGFMSRKRAARVSATRCL